MTKLRQKHPGTVRVAEEWRGSLVVDHPFNIVPARASHLSKHLPVLCKEARDTTFASRALLEAYRQGSLGKGVEPRDEAVWLRGESLDKEGLLNFEGKPRCNEAELGSRCICSVESCLQWFPCSLKYCRNTSGEGEHRWRFRTKAKQIDLNILFQVWDQDLRQMHNFKVHSVITIALYQHHNN